MATRFVDLTLDLIDEGRLVEDMEAELRKVQAALIKYAREHRDKAKKAKASMTVKIELSLERVGEGEEGDCYVIKSDISKKLPGRPTSLSTALSGHSDDNEDVLFVQAGLGAGDDNPKQKRFATRDGRMAEE
jgi:hypothetical protein